MPGELAAPGQASSRCSSAASRTFFEALLLRVALGVDVEFGAVDRETALFFGDEISGDAQAGHANLREFVGGRTND